MPLPLNVSSSHFGHDVADFSIVGCASDDDAIACLCADKDVAQDIKNCSMATVRFTLLQAKIRSDVSDLAQTCPKADQENALTNIAELCLDHGVILNFDDLPGSDSPEDGDNTTSSASKDGNASITPSITTGPKSDQATSSTRQPARPTSKCLPPWFNLCY